MKMTCIGILFNILQHIYLIQELSVSFIKRAILHQSMMSATTREKMMLITHLGVNLEKKLGQEIL